MSVHSLDEVDEAFVEHDDILEMRERIVRAFLDFFILVKLSEEREPLGGYDLIKLIIVENGVKLSAGSVYAVLYSMERDGLIQAISLRKKRVYKLTDKGCSKLQAVSEEKEKLVYLFAGLFV